MVELEIVWNQMKTEGSAAVEFPLDLLNPSLKHDTNQFTLTMSYYGPVICLLTEKDIVSIGQCDNNIVKKYGVDGCKEQLGKLLMKLNLGTDTVKEALEIYKNDEF